MPVGPARGTGHPGCRSPCCPGAISIHCRSLLLVGSGDSWRGLSAPVESERSRPAGKTLGPRAGAGAKRQARESSVRRAAVCPLQRRPPGGGHALQSPSEPLRGPASPRRPTSSALTGSAVGGDGGDGTSAGYRDAETSLFSPNPCTAGVAEWHLPPAAGKGASWSAAAEPRRPTSQRRFEKLETGTSSSQFSGVLRLVQPAQQMASDLGPLSQPQELRTAGRGTEEPGPLPGKGAGQTEPGLGALLSPVSCLKSRTPQTKVSVTCRRKRMRDAGREQNSVSNFQPIFSLSGTNPGCP